MERDRRQLRAWIALLHKGIGARALSRLASLRLEAADLFSLDDAQLQRDAGLTREELAKLRTTTAAALQNDAVDAMEKHQVTLVALGDQDFPANLFSVTVPPPCLFVRGMLLPEDRLAVALVGARMATPTGLAMTERLSRDFAPAFTIISGCAVGIDTAAHRTTMDVGGRTIAVCGCGLDVDYPAGNRELRARIPRHGALVSIFPPGTPPRRGNFPARNTILAGMSMAVIVTEASEKSGALSTAGAAAREGRQVYAVPGDPLRRGTEGTNALLRDGAVLCTSAQDVIADLEGALKGELHRMKHASAARKATAPASDAPAPKSPPRAASPPAPAVKPPPQASFGVGASGAMEKALLASLTDRSAVRYDDLVATLVPGSGSLGDLAQALLLLELDGRIEQLPGRNYRRR